MITKKIACSILTAFYIQVGFCRAPAIGAETGGLPAGVAYPGRGFVSTSPADDWEEALISGNGTIGALVMGQPLEETIIFSHERLFMPSYPILPVVNLAPQLEKIRQLITEGKYRDAAKLAVEESTKYGYRVDDPEVGIHWTDPLTPAFDLRINMTSRRDVRGYARSVDWQTGVATVRWEDEQGAYSRKLFVSRADAVAVLLITGPVDGQLDCRLELAMRPYEGESNGDTDDPVFQSGVKDVGIEAEVPWLTYRSSFKKAYPGSIEGYEGLARVVAKGGSLRKEGNGIIVRDADELLVLVHLDVLADNERSRLSAEKDRLARLEGDFSTLLKRHAAIHGDKFNRVQLELGGSEADHKLTSEELIDKSSLGQLNLALLEKEFSACRYAILSSSGKLPPTLQGVWTGTWSPPWQSDYTQNGNVPSAIASMLMANMPECMEAYLNYMESLVPHFSENARRLYGCRGIMVPSRTSSNGYNTHFNEEYIHLFWTPGAAWASHFFYDYYLYTGDREFLEKRALPFMKEAALFFEDFLREGPDGRYVFNPSYSPENTPADSDSQACINATMDIALVKELLTHLIVACEELGTDREAVQRWQAMLKKMPKYRITKDGTVAEWTTAKLTDNHEHRHASHLVTLFDGLPEEIASSQELRRAFKNVIDKRMGPRRADGGGVMSFGLVQLGQAAASLGEADLAYEAVDMLANVYWRSNMVSTHNPDRIFNVDICGGMPAVIIKMLVASKPGAIELLPALPKQWPSGRISGVLCRGQIEVKELAWVDQTVRVTLKSAIDQVVSVSVSGGLRAASRDGQGIAEAEFKAGSLDVALDANGLTTLVLERVRGRGE